MTIVLPSLKHTVTSKGDMTITPGPLCKSGNEQQENPQTLSQGKGSLETREWRTCQACQGHGPQKYQAQLGAEVLPAPTAPSRRHRRGLELPARAESGGVSTRRPPAGLTPRERRCQDHKAHLPCGRGFRSTSSTCWPTCGSEGII